MNEKEFEAHRKALALQYQADRLFAACLQFTLDKDEKWLSIIRDISSTLLERGYETSFEHKKKALVVRTLFHQLELSVKPVDDKLLPRQSDLEGLDAER
jgi:hypothetical protein